jgi:hypothetical protein
MAPLTGEEALHRYRGWLSDHAAMATVAVALVAVGVLRALWGARARGLWRNADERGFLLTVALCALFTGVAANVTARGFPHYFLQAVPWFALLGGVLLDEALLPPGAPALRRTLVHLGVLVPTLAFVEVLHGARLENDRRAQSDHPRTLPICAYVASRSRADDSIYVWGFAADIYTFCQRRPASRFVYSTFQSGYVPFFDATRAEEHARIVPGSPEQFLGDLESSQAALVIDVGFTMGNRRIDANPQYAAYLADKYCPPVPFDGTRVFERRAPDRACPAR